jgi:hypothetical protein
LRGGVFPRATRAGKKAGGMRSDEQLTDMERIYFLDRRSKKTGFLSKKEHTKQNIFFFTRFVFFVSKFSRDTKKLFFT